METKMKTCLFCKNTRIFNIHNDYGNYNHASVEDMYEFFGYQIQDYLRSDDAICNLCMNIMENVAKLKRRLLPLIFRSHPSYMEDCKPINLGKKWDIFASNSYDDDDNDPTPSSRSPTPSSLLRCKRVVPYEKPLEMKIAELERHRSLSRVSSVISEADSEIVKAFAKKRGRRRKKGHNWTRRKRSRYSSMSTRTSAYSSYSLRSSLSNLISRPVTPCSNVSADSYETFYPPGLGSSSPVSGPSAKKRVRYKDSYPENEKTTCTSKQQGEEIQNNGEEGELHECCINGCGFVCKDINFMAQHKISRHNQLAKFKCNYCEKKYTSNGDLEIHKKIHSKQYSCDICHRKFYIDKDLKEHWTEEHFKKSVACEYCGKRYVDKNVCNQHQKNVHRKNDDYNSDYNENVEEDRNSNNHYKVRILEQINRNISEENIGKKYSSNKNLEIHKRTHSGQYPCDICHRKFYIDKDLMEHWIEEHVKKSVACKYCGKYYVDKNVCDKHQKDVHRNNDDYSSDRNENEKQRRNSKHFKVRILEQINNISEEKPNPSRTFKL